ncbi:type II secretion system F family protein [Corynebacterium freneyi]|uniref:type II secretion system F family protein n=1 Tax=Corynebacterium freneyi TaxID=134034 RepID=UPI00254D68DB|nr:type II secretion system F family protein [Corynebacterium freneyi]MDK8768121.1 type II secretion system F family protein [Corynebacterium freneyi]
MTQASMTAGALLLAAAVWGWPAPSPRDRIPELDAAAGRSGSRGGVVTLPGWAWFVAAAPLLLAGPHVALAAVMVARTVMSLVGQARKRREMDAGTASAARAAEVLAADLRAGATPVAALTAAADEAGQSLAGALAEAASRARLGGSVSAALERAVEDAPAMLELRRLAGAWRVAETHGLRLAEVIDHGRGDIVARRAHRSRTAAALAGPRVTMLILMALPVLGVAMGQALGAGPVGFLFAGGVGGVVLIVGVGLTCAGALWGNRILATAEGTR